LRSRSASALAGDGPAAGQNVRERILWTAYELFCRDGIGATGIDRIVAGAGVAKMSLYNHFASKDELARAVLHMRAELWTHGWLEYEVERRETDPVARLLVLFDIFDEWFRRPDFESCLFIRALFETNGQDSPVPDAATEEFANIRALVRGLAADAGARDPEALAYELQILMSGAVVLATEGDSEAARRARAVAELVLEREGLHPGG
jgi:AcrR family transcriptional regulator